MPLVYKEAKGVFEDVWQDTKLGVGKWRKTNDVYSAFTLARESEVDLKGAQEANRNLRARSWVGTQEPGNRGKLTSWLNSQT